MEAKVTHPGAGNRKSRSLILVEVTPLQVLQLEGKGMAVP